MINILIHWVLPMILYSALYLIGYWRAHMVAKSKYKWDIGDLKYEIRKLEEDRVAIKSKNIHYALKVDELTKALKEARAGK